LKADKLETSIFFKISLKALGLKKLQVIFIRNVKNMI